MDFILLLLIAILLDMVLGDPRWYPHPVQVIGVLCRKCEKFYRQIIQRQNIAGCFTVFSVLIFTVAPVFYALYLLGIYSTIWQTLLAVLVLYSFIAIKDLLHHSQDVYYCLVPSENLDSARIAVGRIVGRDTDNLELEDICKACVETVAENLVDGITAPLFWAILFSFLAPITPLNNISMAAVGITAYKCVNTMDSMFGYKNDRYILFGWAAARLDDLVNYIPARLSGICIVIIAFIARSDWRNSYTIFLRDRLNHSSPNAGHTESAIAGALGLRLGGASYYSGEKVEKPFIGDEVNMVSPNHILITNKMIVYSTACFLLILFLVRSTILVLL